MGLKLLACCISLALIGATILFAAQQSLPLKTGVKAITTAGVALLESHIKNVDIVRIRQQSVLPKLLNRRSQTRIIFITDTTMELFPALTVCSVVCADDVWIIA